MRKALLAIAVVGLVGTAVEARAVDLAPAAVVAARQAAYDLMASTMGDMKRAIDAKSDLKPFKANAQSMAAWARALPAMFPAGTDAGSKALPAIWSDRAGFEKAAAALASASDNLAKAADSDDAGTFAAAYQQAGAACGGCHRTYRAR